MKDDKIYNGDYRWSDNERERPSQTLNKKQLLEKSVQSSIQSLQTDNKILLKNNKEDENDYQNSKLKEIIKLLQRIEYVLESIDGYRRFPYDEKGAEALQKGKIEIYKFRNYYDVDKTIAKAAPNNPNDFDSPVYQRERVFVDLQRNADTLVVANDGPGTLFVIVSHGGEVEFSQEAQIFVGDTKTYYNVYELRLRSPTAGLHYRITEYDLRSSGSIGFIPADVANLHDTPLPLAGTNFFASNLTPASIPTTFGIEIAVSIPGIFSAVITNGGDSQVVNFNPAGANAAPGSSLLANTLYIFQLIIHSGDTVNFRYSATGGTIQILRVQEIDSSSSGV